MSNATTAIETTTDAGTLKQFLSRDAVKARLAECAGKAMKPEALVRMALMAASRQPDLLQCTQESILRALMDAASMGIAPGGVMGRGYLVPRWNSKSQKKEAQFDPGWRGLSDIAKRSGAVKRIDAKVVYEGDAFDYVEGTEQMLRHVPTLDGERGGILAAYAIATFSDGEKQIEVMTRADLDKIRKSSAAKGGPWVDWPEEMSRKSAVRRLCKYLPYTPELEEALAKATEADVDDGHIEAPALSAIPSLPEGKRISLRGGKPSEPPPPPPEPTVDASTGEVIPF
jgi:recombination protein RecT